MEYDVIIIGAGPGGIFSAYELMKKSPETRVAVFEEGNTLEKRKCPIDGKKVKACIKCPTCAIMNGFGGAGAFSDGKYNITNDFGGTLYEYIGREKALELMNYVDEINCAKGGGDRLIHKENLPCPGCHDGFYHGVSFNAGNGCRNADRYARLDDARTAYLIDKPHD